MLDSRCGGLHNDHPCCDCPDCDDAQADFAEQARTEIHAETAWLRHAETDHNEVAR